MTANAATSDKSMAGLSARVRGRREGRRPPPRQRRSELRPHIAPRLVPLPRAHVALLASTKDYLTAFDQPAETASHRHAARMQPPAGHRPILRSASSSSSPLSSPLLPLLPLAGRRQALMLPLATVESLDNFRNRRTTRSRRPSRPRGWPFKFGTPAGRALHRSSGSLIVCGS